MMVEKVNGDLGDLTLNAEQLNNVRKRLLHETWESFGDIAFLSAYQMWVYSMWHHHSWSGKTFPTTVDEFLMTVGLGGEAGEVQEVIKKQVRDGTPIDSVREQLTSELGDVLYYLVMIANRYGIALDQIIKGNVEKLETRREQRQGAFKTLPKKRARKHHRA